MGEGHVLLAARVDGTPAQSDAPSGGDWQLSVILEIWAPRSADQMSAVYEFNVGSLNFGGLVPGDDHGGGLVDPAKINYLREGNFVGVLVERSALSAIEDVSVEDLGFVAVAEPQVYIDNGYPESREGVIVGWEGRGHQECPNSSDTMDIARFESSASSQGDPEVDVSTASTGQPQRSTTTTSGADPDAPADLPEIEIGPEGLGGVPFGTETDAAQAVLERVLGYDHASEYLGEACGVERYATDWAGIHVEYGDDKFIAVRVDPAEVPAAIVRTSEGIVIGSSTAADLRATYGDRVDVTDSGRFGIDFGDGLYMQGFVSGDGSDTDVVIAIRSGAICGNS